MAGIPDVALVLVATVTALILHGCGSSGHAKPKPPSPSPSPSPHPMLPLKPMRGVAYGALPCPPWGKPNCSVGGGGQLPPGDMVQDGYALEWGSAHDGRDDLGTIRSLGGNAVRLYASIGQESKVNHAEFLDYAFSQGIHVLAGVDTGNTRNCTNFDCHDQFADIMTACFKLGFLKGKKWHPAISMVILLNEPDFLGGDPSCPKGPGGKGLAWCRVKAVISALDGTLTAEKRAGVEKPFINLTTTWSFGVFESIDKKVKGPGYFGFQDVEAATLDPSLANYKPQNAIRNAYIERWVHGVNVQAPFDYVWSTISPKYAPWSAAPWFIGELGEGSQDLPHMLKDLQQCLKAAKEDKSFLGAAVFQFQTAYHKGGSEMNFGLFALGKTKLGEEKICQSLPDGEHCESHEVYCTTDNLEFLPVTLRSRAKAVATAWNGTVPKSRCKESHEVNSVIV